MSLREYHCLICDQCGRESDREPAYYLPRLIAQRKGWRVLEGKKKRGQIQGPLTDFCPGCWAKRREQAQIKQASFGL